MGSFLMIYDFVYKNLDFLYQNLYFFCVGKSQIFCMKNLNNFFL